MIRAVFDTNTVISGFLWTGAPASVIDAALDERVQLLCSVPLLDELKRTFSRPKIIKRLNAIEKTADSFLFNYQRVVEIVEPTELPEFPIRDPKDKMVIACAVGGKAAYIVSGDKDLLELKNYEIIPICTANTFLEILEKQ